MMIGVASDQVQRVSRFRTEGDIYANWFARLSIRRQKHHHRGMWESFRIL